MKLTTLDLRIWSLSLALAIAGSVACEENKQTHLSILPDVDQQSLELNDPESATSKGLQITLDESWELDDLDNVKDILYEAANYIYRHLENGPHFQVEVGYDRKRGPISLYRNADEDFDRVLLNTTPLEYRPQLMYQFSHEFCHVISDFNRIRSTESKNEWFHESLCELASIFVLHSTNVLALKNYIDDYLEESRELLSSIPDFGSWMLSKEDGLRAKNSGRLDRVTNAVVAYRIYPFFKQNPRLWNTLWHLPKSDSTLAAYFSEWKQDVDEQDRHLLTKLGVLLLGEQVQL